MSLEKATQIMYEEFGFKPEKTKIIYHEQDNWINVLNKNGIKGIRSLFTKGIYLSPELEVHVPKNASLHTLIHEYLGHGSFFEHSKSGKKIISHMKEINKMERELFKRKISARQEMSEEEISKIISSFLKKLESDKGIDKKILKYYNLRHKTAQLIHKTNCKNEGFATWIEYHLSQKIAFNWSKLSISPEYYAYFTILQYHKRKYGLKKMLRYVGF